MRVLSITAGAGGMYCGSCFRDNALAAELRRQGHAVTLLPIYTPTRTDEENVSEPRVFFGGVSVYLEQNVPLFRRTPWLLDRIWDLPSVIRLATRFSVSTDPKLLGELTLSTLRGKEGFQRKEILKLVDWLTKQEPYDVVNLPNSLLIGLAAPLREALGRPVLCTLQGEDLFLDGLREPYRAEALELIRKNVDAVDGFLAVSAYYAEFMSEFLRIPQDRMHVVPLGIELEGYAPGERAPGGPLRIGYFARIAPEKGLDRLCGAYRLLRERGELGEARLEVAGYLGPEHRSYLREVQSNMEGWGLGKEMRYHGALDRKGKIDFLRGLDVLSVPSRYREPKGIYLLEAMACGVPVVQPRHGAFPEILDKAPGGILVDPDDEEALAAGLLSIARDRERAAELGRKGREGVRLHYDVTEMARRALAAYESCLSGSRRARSGKENLAKRA